MTKIVGRLEDVGIGVEATRGTAVAASYWLPALSKDFDDKVEMIVNESSFGVLHKDSGMTKRSQWAEGTIEMKVRQTSIGAVLTALAGAAPSTAVSSGEYTHTWTQTNTITNKSLTISMKDSNLDLRFANAMLNSATFSWELDQYFRVELGFMSKKSAVASNTVAHTAENEFAPKHSVIKLASTQSGLSGAAAIDVRAASLTFSKNVEARYILGSVEAADLHNKQVEITGTLEVYYDGSTYKDYVFNETEKAMRLSVVNTDVTLANSSNPHIYFDLYKVRFSDWQRSRSNDDIVTETVSFRALIDLSNSSRAYTIELLNSVANTTYS